VAAEAGKRDDREEKVMDVASRRRSMAATINSRQAMMMLVLVLMLMLMLVLGGTLVD
jgi:hypothetical protein